MAFETQDHQNNYLKHRNYLFLLLSYYTHYFLLITFLL